MLFDFGLIVHATQCLKRSWMIETTVTLKRKQKRKCKNKIKKNIGESNRKVRIMTQNKTVTFKIVENLLTIALDSYYADR